MFKHLYPNHRSLSKLIVLPALLFVTSSCQSLPNLQKNVQEALHSPKKILHQVINSKEGKKSQHKVKEENKAFYEYNYRIVDVYDINGHLSDEAKEKFIGKSFNLSQAFERAVKSGKVDQKTGQLKVPKDSDQESNPAILVKGYDAFKSAAVDALSYSEETINKHIEEEGANKTEEEKAAMRKSYEDDRQNVMNYVENSYLSQDDIKNRLSQADIDVDDLNNAYFSMNSPFLPDSFWLPIKKGNKLIVATYSKDTSRPDSGLILVLKRK